MTAVADTNLLADLQKFGAAEISACFSCGNCTAICPMADADGLFPRRMIRYAMVGLSDELRSSKELWTCYHCGECSDACPTEADPGEFMATARRYAIASYDKTGLAKLMYTRPIAGTLSGLVFFFAFAFLLFGFREDSPTSPAAKTFWDFIPYHPIHNIGMALMVLVAIAGLVGVATMARSLAKRDGITLSTIFGSKEGRAATVKALWYSVGLESIGQRRYRDDCKGENKPVEPLFVRRWFVHALTLWGFLGLLAATTINYVLDVLGIKATGTPVHIWYPVRLLGTVSGLAFLYGVTMFMIWRWKKHDRTSTTSSGADWLFLVLLWITGFTGFFIELVQYSVTNMTAWGQFFFLTHVAIAMELVLFLPFTKFAHAIYRPVALFFHSLAASKREREAASV